MRRLSHFTPENLDPRLRHDLAFAGLGNAAPSGFTDLDSSGRGSHGVVKNADPNTAVVWAQELGRWAFASDGTGTDYLNTTQYRAATIPAFASNEAVSACCWIKPASFANFTGIIGNVYYTGTFPGWLLQIHGDATVGTFMGSHRWTTATISAGRWWHIGFSYGAGVLKHYINGVEQYSATSVTYVGHSSSQITYPKFYVEAGGAGGANAFTGQQADVMVWRRAIPAPVFSLLANPAFAPVTQPDITVANRRSTLLQHLNHLVG